MDKFRKIILMVEDDPNDVALFRRALRKSSLDAEVIVLEDGESAIQWFTERTGPSASEENDWPRLVVLDIKMPRISGLDVLEWLRRQPVLRRLPVIALTSSREKEDILRAYDLGINSYLVKPVAFDQLKEMIRMMYRYWIDWNEKADMD
jgi:CheY-like chemotaxis protein